MSTSTQLTAALRAHVRPGMTVALGDGVGTPTSVCAALSEVAREVGDVKLVLGWHPSALDGLAADAFADVVAMMPGWGVRDVLATGSAHFVPVRLSGMPALLAEVLRPDVLITRLVDRDNAWHFGTEVSWQRAVVDAGVPVLAMVDDAAPCADAGPQLEPAAVQILGHCSDGPVQFSSPPPKPVHENLAEAVLRFIPDGTRLQYGPGQLGTALLAQARRPLQVDTGLLTDAVVDLDERGLLTGIPSATYLLGSSELFDWADGKPILRGVEYTHDISRLSRGVPLVAVNTAIEIDPVGQINVEGVGEKVVGGIGGHPDYCAAASMGRGLSIIAVPSRVKGRSPLVEQLSRPTSTPAYDVDVIVTETGHADLRGADWTQRRRLIAALFE
ncbi:acetyl-CoA hydrolase/transferase C-terminal domain-containing protein [Mycolicibacterium sp. XJ1819]